MKTLPHRHEFWLTLILLALCAGIAAVNPTFLTLENAFDVLTASSFLGILALGVFLVLLAGEIDISFTATATVAQYLTAVWVNAWGGNLLLMLALALAVGWLLGAGNALLVHYLKMPGIIATIATWNIYFGLLMFCSGGRQILRLPDWFHAWAGTKLIAFSSETTTYGLTLPAVMFLTVGVLVALASRYTMLGRSIHALGGSPLAAARVGLPIARLRLVLYGTMGALAGLAGLVLSLRTQMVNPHAIVGKELDVYAAVVLGGASLKGGRGSAVGTLLGVALIAILSNGMTLMHVPSVWYQVVIGVVILASVTFNALRIRAARGHAIAGEAS